ncbi:MAG: inorganic phosphate transporter [Chlamydiota bacterium]
MEWIVLIVVLALIFDYTNGFHDAANVVSTVIATKALKPLTAVLLAGLLNTLGAMFIGGVAKTIATGIINPLIATQPLILSAIIGAISWNILTWYFGIPSSSSYALIGGMVGAAFMCGSGMIFWGGVMYKVIIPMILSPLIGFALAFFVMKILYLTAYKKGQAFFRHLQILSASFVALAHGLNDAQKSMGIITLGLFSGGFLASPHIPMWVVLSCAVMIGLGTAFGGMRIVKTVGFKITRLEPTQGFAAETSASCITLIASFLGMPISSTHMIVGSVTGVGSAKGLKSVKWAIFKKLIIAWILTIPGSACISYFFYYLISSYL